MWLKRWNWRKLAKRALDEQQAVLKELEEAKQEWIHAYQKLDHVTEKEQIDYAIFALEAAEKRYEMLLRKVKEHYSNSKDKGKEKGRKVMGNEKATQLKGNLPLKANVADHAFDEAGVSKEDAQ